MTVEGRMRCPHCHGGLQREGGTLHCPSHGAFARSAAGVYLFLQDDVGYFDEHWKHNRLPEMPLAKRETGTRFLSFLFSEAAPRGGTARWLDVGTGDGVHLAIVREFYPEVEFVGVDISGPGLEAVAQRFPEATLLNADGQSIPLQDNSADASFSYGTLAYMDDPWKGLSELVRITKPGGVIGVWFYPKRGDLAGFLFRLTRRIVSRVPALCQRVLANLIVPFLSLLPTASGVSLKNASWKACREVVLVNIAPPTLLFPTQEEVCERFVGLKCDVVHTDNANPIAVWARKRVDPISP